jgi:hypothetical protein
VHISHSASRTAATCTGHVASALQLLARALRYRALFQRLSQSDPRHTNVAKTRATYSVHMHYHQPWGPRIRRCCRHSQDTKHDPHEGSTTTPVVPAKQINSHQKQPERFHDASCSAHACCPTDLLKQEAAVGRRHTARCAQPCHTQLVHVRQCCLLQCINTHMVCCPLPHTATNSNCCQHTMIAHCWQPPLLAGYANPAHMDAQGLLVC